MIPLETSGKVGEEIICSCSNHNFETMEFVHPVFLLAVLATSIMAESTESERSGFGTVSKQPRKHSRPVFSDMSRMNNNMLINV